MANARKKPAKPSTPASAGELRTKATQDDIWAHAIYLEARKKIVGPVLAFVGVLAALGLYTSVEFYRSLQKLAAEQVATTINEGIKMEVQTLLMAAQPDLEKRLKEATDAAIAKAVKDALEKIAKTSESANAASQRLKDIALAGQPAVERPVAIARGKKSGLRRMPGMSGMPRGTRFSSRERSRMQRNASPPWPSSSVRQI